jgi:DNA polymerase-3 subunit gamma/tau
MLSGHSFNALLKTLEEPPPHVKFLLATTDPQKLPVTVLSRCLQFNLKRMPIPLIEGHLQFILQQEGLDFDQLSLRLLAHGADGSMRDALSLLDQAIAYGGGKLDADEVQAMMGTVSRDRILAILKAVIANDAPAVMAEVAALAEMTPDYQAALADVLALLHQIALAQYVPEAVDENLVERETLQQLALDVSAEDVQLFYQIGLLGRKDLPLAPDARSGFEMALLRMLAFKPSIAARQAAPVQARQADSVARVDNSPQSPAPSAVDNTAVASPSTKPKGQFGNDWQGLINSMGVKGMVKQLAVNCVLQSRNGNEINLKLSEDRSQLLNPAMHTKLQDALSEYLDEKIKLVISVGQTETETPAETSVRHETEKQQAAELSIEQDPVVQALKDNFDAVVVPNSVQPVD